MADYVAREWNGGDIVTATNLNHIEQGIAEASQSGGGTEPLVVKATTEGATVTLDKTFGEIKEAFNSGKMIWLAREETDEEGAFAVYTPVNQFIATEPSGGAIIFVLNNNLNYMAATDQDYPKAKR